MLVTLPLHPGLEALRDGFFMLDPEWRVTYWNAAAERLLGIPREAICGRVLWEELPHLRESPIGVNLQQVRDAHTAREFLEPYPARGVGGALTVSAVSLDEEGIAVHFRDVTDELRLTERYSRLVESIQDGFVAVDPDWTLVYINGVAESLLHLPRERALGTGLWSLLPEEPAEVAESLRATMGDGVPRYLRGVQSQAPVLQGRVFDLGIYPLPGGGISILFQDVSEQYQRERELARLAEEAREANQAKSRFFAAVSHELRTPLNAIVGYIYLLATEAYGPVPPAARRAAERAGVCAEHLSRLVDDVLLLTTTEVGRLPVVPVAIPLAGFLSDIAEPLRQQAEAKGLEFSLDISDADLTLVTDPDRLRQILLALLTNAVKFTPRGGVRVEVRASEEGSDVPGQEAGESFVAPPFVEIVVRDTGPGIPPEERERIFDAFEQLGDPSRSGSMRHGTGLGLTIARQLAALLRGDLRLESDGGPGAVFRLCLPAVYAE